VSVKNLLNVTIVCGTIASASLAQGGPSYDETISFIERKANVSLNSYVASDTGIRHSASSSVSFPNRCVLEKEHLAKDNGEVVHRTVDRLDVSDLDPSRVEIVAGQINLYIFESRREVVSREWNEGRGWSNDKYLNSIWLNTFDRETNLPKLQRAFVHLILLCGGQEELF